MLVHEINKNLRETKHRERKTSEKMQRRNARRTARLNSWNTFVTWGQINENVFGIRKLHDGSPPRTAGEWRIWCYARNTNEHGKKFTARTYKYRGGKFQISGVWHPCDIERTRWARVRSLQLFLFITPGLSAGVFERRGTRWAREWISGPYLAGFKYRSKCNTPRDLLTFSPAISYSRS